MPRITLNEIGKKLNLSPRTIEFYLQNARKKVACGTKTELIKLTNELEVK